MARQADADLFDGLQQDEFCYVLNTRQMGKSSLMIRAAQRLRAAGGRVIALDLTAVGKNLTVEQWYGGLAVRLAQQTDQRDALLDFWRSHTNLGPMQRLIEALRQVLLAPEAGQSGKVIIFLDEIDMVRSLPFSADELFAGIRECYNRRASDPVFQNLTFCLLGVATPSDLIQDTRISPFNIGRRIELRDFTPEEAEPLALGLLPVVAVGTDSSGGTGDLYARLDPRAFRLLKRVLYWTNGHPYMTQRLCRAVAGSLAEEASRQQEDEDEDELEDMALVDAECERFFLSKAAREADDNLAFVRNRLLFSEADKVAVLELYRKVRLGRHVRDDETNPLCSILRLSGVVAVERGVLRLRNRVYHQIFEMQWIASHMPDAELQRQKQAYKAGLLRAVALSSLIIIAMAALTAYALVQKQVAISNAHRANANSLKAHDLATVLQFTLDKAQQNADRANRNAIAQQLPATCLREPEVPP